MATAQTPNSRHLLLLGGGHSHLHVLRMAAMQPMRNVRITLVSPDSHTVYSGMMPGTLAGLYAPEDGRIDLRALAARAKIRFLRDRAVRIDAAARRVDLSRLPSLSYDVLSIDVGSRPRGLPNPIPSNLVPIKPIEAATQRLHEFADAARRGDVGRRVAVVGAGAGGVEVAFAVRARLRELPGASITVLDRADGPLASYPPRVVRKVSRLFPRYGIEFLGAAEVTRVDDRGLVIADGRRLEADLIVWTSGAEGFPLFRESGLETDELGFLLVTDRLQCIADPEIFAAGDCATIVQHPDLPKAGVYAVREGPLLWKNLRAALSDTGPLQAYEPQSGFLSLMSTGDRRALASYRGWAAHGRWVWRLKDWIDRRFVRKHRPPRPAEFEDARALRGLRRSLLAMEGAQMAPCGGCAAKVGADVLARVLKRLELRPNPDVVIGLEFPDDAAVVVHPAGAYVVSTIDFFPPFLDDPYLVGAVAAVNAASDLYAMGAEPRSAMAMVALPRVDEREAEETVELLLRGALGELNELGISLVGGHTIESEALLFGFAVNGAARNGQLLRKGGARVGDNLVLTKPLGTGVVLAAARAGAAPAEWVEATLESMLQPNRGAAEALRRARAHACTDVTGFGLAGHLLEMMQASNTAARLRLSQLPSLPGAEALLRAGFRSSFHPRTRSCAAAVRIGKVDGGDPRIELLFDPQTSGGLLAAVAPDAVETLSAELKASGVDCAVIGEVVEGEPELFVQP